MQRSDEAGSASGRSRDLLSHPLFQGADRATVERLLGHSSVRQVGAGEMVIGPADGSCLLVFEGSLLSYVLMEDGRRVLFEVIRAGGVDGILNVMLGAGGHFSEAAERSVVAPIDRCLLEALIDEEPVIARTIMRLSLRRLQRREAQVQAVAHHEATRRVASILLSLARYVGRPRPGTGGAIADLAPRPTHQVLADMVGLRRETVTIEMGRLRRLGAVRLEGTALIVDKRLLAGAVETEARRSSGAL